MIYNFDELKFRVLSVVKINHKDGLFKVKSRSFSALAFRFNGSSTITANNKSRVTSKGDILYLPSGITYEASYKDNEMIVIHFSECNYNNGIENFKSENPQFFGSYFKKIYDFWNENECIYKINALIYELFCEMRMQEQQKDCCDTFSDAIEYINKNFTNPMLSVAQICKKFGISEANLRLKFNRKFNLPPKKYILKLRLGLAVDMLSKNAYSIEQITSDCGFTDSKYFAKVIKETYGVSPSKLAKRLIM